MDDLFVNTPDASTLDCSSIITPYIAAGRPALPHEGNTHPLAGLGHR